VNESEASPPSQSVEYYRARDLLRAPGLISWCRLPLAALFPFVFRNPAYAIGLLVAAALSDVLDGWVARRFHQQTAVGALLDGAMDKLFAMTALATLVLASSLSLVEALVLSTREIGEGLLIALALWLRPRSTASSRSAVGLGKLATVLQFTAILVVLLRRGPRTACVVAAGGTGALAVATYFRREFAPRPESP
jgi:cardiolipin synthase